MHSESPVRMTPLSADTRRQLLVTGAVCGVLVAVLVLFWPTTVSMVQIWRRSDTFAHCFLVLPIVVALVWRSSAALVGTPASHNVAALLLTLPVGFVWLLGELANSNAPSQLALISLVPLC